MKMKLKIGLAVLGVVILIVVLFFIFQNKSKDITEYPFGLSAKKADNFCIDLLEGLKSCSEGPEDPKYIEACTKAKTLDLTIDAGFSEEVIQKVLEYCQE